MFGFSLVLRDTELPLPMIRSLAHVPKTNSNNTWNARLIPNFSKINRIIFLYENNRALYYSLQETEWGKIEKSTLVIESQEEIHEQIRPLCC